MRVLIGINSLTESQWPAYNSHLRLFYALGRNFLASDMVLYNPSRVSIDRMRNGAAELAVNGAFDYLWFIDDDVIPIPDALTKLLECDADIAAGDVIIRGYPFDHMCFKYTDKKKQNLKALASYPKGVKIISVDAVGFSMCLIKVSLLRKLQTPYFITNPMSTEDIYFCIKARDFDKNCTIRVNTTLECGHILWPEIISSANKKNYKKYLEAQNPVVKQSPQSTMLRVYNVEAGTTYEDVMGKKELKCSN